MPDDDETLSPDRMLALVTDQQRSIQGQKGALVPLILLAWGIAWLVGFAALWLIDGPGISLSFAAGLTIFVGLFLLASCFSTFAGIRSARGLRGGADGAFAGIVYGQAWWIGSIAICAIGLALVHNGMSSELLVVFYPSAYVFFTGLMFVLAAALWRAVPMLILGAWSVIVGVAAPFAGHPAHLLVYALAGGGGILIVAFWSWVWGRRARAPLSAGRRRD